MAHIADLMVNTSDNVGLNQYIARELSPHSHQDTSTEVLPAEEKERYIWRMQQPTEPRKYQLFPGLEKLSVPSGRKSPDQETAPQMVNGQIAPNGNAVRKPKEQIVLRRRKVSVPELGPMTTVQEIAMDSPTIPGRPPLHERSISAPGNTWRQHVFGESMLSCIVGPVLDEQAELAISTSSPSPTQSTTMDIKDPTFTQSTSIITGSSSPKQPLSPKSLTPLVIPVAKARIVHHSSTSRLRNEFTRPEVPPKPSRSKEHSPYPRSSPYTPMSSAISLPIQTSAPHSAPEGRSSPKPWMSSSSSHSPSPLGHSRGQSETVSTQSRPAALNPIPNQMEHSRTQSDTSHFVYPQHTFGHRRGDSEGSSSILDRGRPKKRSETVGSSPQKQRSVPRLAPSVEEQRAFEYLPAGVRATNANTVLSPNEVDMLRNQAIGQASRFEVLNYKDVEGLSRELRSLDERCEYLRKTHRSLRSGRRNLHDRICSYLRSPRVARFSHESILKQEEALSELDTSIDDWVSKLEQAENRRTRVRQKLLEHVAAALIMQPSSPSTAATHAALAMAVGPSGENTPPRSPTKRDAFSPSREMSRVVEEVQISSPEKLSRKDVESIRIYADSDVYALLADVEQEINRMGDLDASDAREREAEAKDVADRQAKQQEQAKQEMEKEAAAKKEVNDNFIEGLTLSSLTFEALPARTYTPPARSFTPPTTTQRTPQFA